MAVVSKNPGVLGTQLDYQNSASNRLGAGVSAAAQTADLFWQKKKVKIAEIGVQLKNDILQSSGGNLGTYAEKPEGEVQLRGYYKLLGFSPTKVEEMITAAQNGEITVEGLQKSTENLLARGEMYIDRDSGLAVPEGTGGTLPDIGGTATDDMGQNVGLEKTVPSGGDQYIYKPTEETVTEAVPSTPASGDNGLRKEYDDRVAAKNKGFVPNTKYDAIIAIDDKMAEAASILESVINSSSSSPAEKIEAENKLKNLGTSANVLGAAEKAEYDKYRTEKEAYASNTVKLGELEQRLGIKSAGFKSKEFNEQDSGFLEAYVQADDDYRHLDMISAQYLDNPNVKGPNGETYGNLRELAQAKKAASERKLAANDSLNRFGYHGYEARDAAAKYKEERDNFNNSRPNAADNTAMIIGSDSYSPGTQGNTTTEVIKKGTVGDGLFDFLKNNQLFGEVFNRAEMFDLEGSNKELQGARQIIVEEFNRQAAEQLGVDPKLGMAWMNDKIGADGVVIDKAEIAKKVKDAGFEVPGLTNNIGGGSGGIGDTTTGGGIGQTASIGSTTSDVDATIKDLGATVPSGGSQAWSDYISGNPVDARMMRLANKTQSEIGDAAYRKARLVYRKDAPSRERYGSDLIAALEGYTAATNRGDTDHSQMVNPPSQEDTKEYWDMMAAQGLALERFANVSGNEFESKSAEVQFWVDYSNANEAGRKALLENNKTIAMTGMYNATAQKAMADAVRESNSELLKTAQSNIDIQGKVFQPMYQEMVDASKGDADKFNKLFTDQLAKKGPFATAYDNLLKLGTLMTNQLPGASAVLKDSVSHYQSSNFLTNMFFPTSSKQAVPTVTSEITLDPAAGGQTIGETMPSNDPNALSTAGNDYYNNLGVDF